LKFFAGILLGAMLTVGGAYALPESMMHPRLSKALASLRDAREYLEKSSHDFGGHKVEALRATDEAIKQLELARAYKEHKR
jgi:hypothetical protein